MSNTHIAEEQTMLEYIVNDQIILAGQPQPKDWQRLVDRGFGLVINMRGDPERAAVQAERAESVGLRYMHLPLPAYELEPEHLDVFRKALAQAGLGKVLIHCRTASRVALVWMLHRMLNEGWSRERAEAELCDAGYDEDSMDTFCFCADDYFERIEAK
ncbi:MAG: hypothetical protein GFH27_549293n150 [Chloroflexi bacterium AL-W]|nr:hypothetical protein [Chloroflexi bacterium AL-N1]NOK67735.1 hypothetical protein [Chloroflexi bacterium AL-N10]NOK75495.1 hypothetical protein [Chloroflexi bacterium AL-N5]NOK82283.1 hypothetical protein [Chloroflexi bacterium AL-W]NOK90128.1 hypothetical protein [Chloroflexi bacterium AL-N15]